MLQLKKKKGESTLSGAMALSMFVLVAFVILKLMFNYYTTIDAVDEVKMIARTSLLQMELKGCLEQEDINYLVSKLTALGMTDIKISGNFDYSASSSCIKNNEYPGAYGEDVYIQVEGILNIDTKTINFLGIQIDISKPTVHVNTIKKGVAVK